MDTCGSIFPTPYYSGDDNAVNIQFYKPDNVTPKPMTGYTVGMTVKAALDDGSGNLIPDSQALYKHDLAGDATGLFVFVIPAQTTGNPTLAPGNYFLDVKQWDPAGKRSNVLTTMLPVNQSVTLRASPNAPGLTTDSPPVLNSLDPAETTAGTSNLALTVNGSGFVSGSRIVFAGLYQSTNFISATQLGATVYDGLHSVGDVPVNVLNPDGQQSPVINFHVT